MHPEAETPDPLSPDLWHDKGTDAPEAKVIAPVLLAAKRKTGPFAAWITAMLAAAATVMVVLVPAHSAMERRVDRAAMAAIESMIPAVPSQGVGIESLQSANSSNPGADTGLPLAYALLRDGRRDEAAAVLDRLTPATKHLAATLR